MRYELEVYSSSLITRHFRRSDRAFTLLTLTAFAVLILPPLLWLLAAAFHSSLVTRHSSLIPWRLLARSVGVAAGSTALATLCGMPYGLLVARARLPARRFLTALGALPLLVPSYAAA